jgi:histidinol-phosphate phosphatase family protein
MTTTVFIDRDGVLNEKPEEHTYVTRWSEFRFVEGATDAVRMLNDAGVRVVAVTNQRGIARGIMTIDDVERLHGKMAEELQSAGARLDAVYYCPHGANSCDCRKPGVGLFLRAKSDFPDISFEESFVIGDSDGDMEAGRRIGAKLIRIGPNAAPDEQRCGSLMEAVKEHILGDG